MKSSVLRPPSSSVHGPLQSLGCRLPSVICRLASGFTLIEVMVVVGIIAILAALMFQVIIGARKKALERQALAESKLIFTAINAYRQEYGKWPAQWQTANDTTYIKSNKCVILPLIGSNWSGFNPKNKMFLPLQTNSLDSDGNYLDPWGSPYVICMDENGDNQLSIFNTNIVYTNQLSGIITIYVNQTVANQSVGAASLGGSTTQLNWYSWQL